MERTRTPSTRSAPFTAGRSLHVGVVHAGGEICHIAADPSPEGLARRLGDYIRRHARWQLWPADAERVLGLLDEGDARSAVELYFGRTGERWDRECLVVEAVDFGGRGSTEG